MLKAKDICKSKKLKIYVKDEKQKGEPCGN